MLCPHCIGDFTVLVGGCIGFRFHWVGDYYLIEAVLIYPEFRKVHVLHREVFHLV